MRTSRSSMSISLAIVTSVSLALAGCSGKEQGPVPLPDDYAEADQVRLSGAPLATDDASCGKTGVTFAAVKEHIPNRRVLAHRFTAGQGGAQSTLWVELQADLTTATCVMSPTALAPGAAGGHATGGEIADQLQMRGMLRLVGAEGLLDVRLPTKLVCQRWTGAAAVDCTVFADGEAARNRGSYLPPGEAEGGRLSVRGSLEKGLLLTWLSRQADEATLSDAELSSHVELVGKTER